MAANPVPRRVTQAMRRDRDERARKNGWVGPEGWAVPVSTILAWLVPWEPNHFGRDSLSAGPGIQV